MELNNEMLQRYVGGQFSWKDVIDRSERYAGIQAIQLRDDCVHLNFFWAADVTNYAGEELETVVEQIFDFASFPIHLGFGDFRVEQRASLKKNVYDVMVFIDNPGGYTYELYPHGDLGLDLSKIHNFKMPN